ncbi:hypothetical protein L484_018277 [Morus notabilis]|uniref:Uncharacterized protein n=1 Tax=Morus notabilis TaxID=981085 RepID=W9SD79_9ROSA|nr:hypothetical protein L484_018277 [Morus notabilis]
MQELHRNNNLINNRRQVMPIPFLTPSRLKTLFLLLSLLFILLLLLRQPPPLLPVPAGTSASATHRRHLLFSIASSARSWRRRKPYVRLWYNPKSTRAFVFLDSSEPLSDPDPSLPPAIVSEDASRFPYTFRGGLRSAIRVARVVKEVVDRGEPGVRWFVFGDDDTVFFVDNLVRTLSKYDHERWFYVGSNSEGYEQNAKNSFDMAFGGGGFAISSSLARALAKVFDSCLVRYAHLYGSDARVFSCVAELGVGLTHEPGFHQVDVRGNLFGLLSAHPLSPLLSLHHLDAVDPIFPNTNRTQALERLFEAVNVDPARILQQTVCYDSSRLLTISVAWGYAIQVFEGNELLPDLLSVQKTFTPWRRSARVDASHYMFNMRDFPKDICKGPGAFFLESVISDQNGIQSNYARYSAGNCPEDNATKNLEYIRVFSKTLELDIEQTTAINVISEQYEKSNST